MNIYQRINEIRKLAAYAKKDKRVDGGGGYMAVTHDAVTALLRDAMVEHGVVVVPALVASKVADTTTTTAKGIPIIRYEAEYDVRFVNADDPQEFVSTRIGAHALDQGDKAPGKAISYAVKYAMLKLFSIETGEDDEGREAQYAANDKKRKPQLPEIGGEASKSVAKSELDRVKKDNPDLYGTMTKAAAQIAKALSDDRGYDALELYTTMRDSLAAEDQIALWGLFDATQRSALKAFGKQANERVE